MEKPIVKDQHLKELLNDLYRPKSSIGVGSTADAVRHEIATGKTVGGCKHLQKSHDYSKALKNWLNKNPTAARSDIAAAENVLIDLQNALQVKK